jgi:hypothetical protein
MAIRLRHIALVAGDMDAVATQLRDALGLDAPYLDDPYAPGFGVRNAVFALGDRFLEVMAPTREGTPAGRHLTRRGGDAGYMVMFQCDDVVEARARAVAAGVRLAWELDLPDMSGTHLHPGDMPGAIVALDQPRPPEAWRWAGPDWVGGAGTGAAARLTGVTLAVPDPAAVAARWAEVLGVDDVPDVTFRRGEGGLVEAAVELPAGVRAGRDAVDVGGVRFVLSDRVTVRPEA